MTEDAEVLDRHDDLDCRDSPGVPHDDVVDAFREVKGFRPYTKREAKTEPVETREPRIHPVRSPRSGAVMQANLANLKPHLENLKNQNTNGSYLRKLAREHTELAIQTLVNVCLSQGNVMARVHAANALLDRGWGRPHLLQETKEAQPVTKIKVSFEGSGAGSEAVTIDQTAEPAIGLLELEDDA